MGGPPLVDGRADKAAFYRWLGPAAQDINRRTGIPASITLAQGYLESKSGTTPGYSVLLIRHNNPFGMKIGSCTRELASGSVSLHTWEYEPGNIVTGAFAVYPSVYAAVVQRALMFYHPSCAGYYGSALAHRGNPPAFLEAIASSYATDPNYAQKVWSDVQAYGLTRWDAPADSWTLDPRLVPAHHIATWQGAVLS